MVSCFLKGVAAGLAVSCSVLLSGPLQSESLPGSAWIQASEFAPLSAEQLFSKIFQRVKEVKEQGGEPLIMIDLDETIYDFRPRNKEVYRKWSQEEAPNSSLARIVRSSPLLLDQRSPYHMSWQLDLSGIPYDTKAVEELIAYWQEHSQSNEYVHLDRPFPQAVEMITALYEAGAKIVYLTSRFEDMREGTLRNLARDNFPSSEQGCPLVMRVLPRGQQVAWQLKVDTLQQMVIDNPRLQLVAAIDNEPGTVTAIYEQFPSAYNVFIHSWFGERTAEVVDGPLYCIMGFPQVQDCE